MKIIFAGTPDFACPSLQALIDSPHEIAAVYTQPDRPKGRGQHVVASPVKLLAQKHHLPVFQPLNLKTENLPPADVMIVAAYGLILPKRILDAPRYGCINVHASLLPRWRGASPIQQAILAGDKESGVTIMQMDVGLDNGDILLQKKCAIERDDSAQNLHDKIAKLGADALIETLNSMDNLTPLKQDESLVTHAPKIQKSDAKINWQKSALEIERQVRGFNPWPIAFCEFKGQPLRIWQATALSEKAHKAPGSIESHSKEALIVATGDGLLAIKKLQCAGGKAITAKDFINAHKEIDHEKAFT